MPLLRLSRLALLAVVASSLAIIAPAVAQEVKPLPVFLHLRDGQKQKVVLFGTSLTLYSTWGLMLKDWLEKEYPGQTEVVNNGGPGRNSDWGVRQLKEKVLDLKPDLVFLEFSYNDAVTRFNLPVEKCAENLDKMVKDLRAQNPDVSIVLQVMSAPWDAPKSSAAKDRPQLEAYNDTYRKYAKDNGLVLLDHYPQYKKLQDTDPERYKKLVPDGSHPDKDAVLVAAWPTIQGFLERQKTAALKAPPTPAPASPSPAPAAPGAASNGNGAGAPAGSTGDASMSSPGMK